MFGESPSRVVVSVRETEEDNFIDFMNDNNVPFSLLGHVTKGNIRVDEESFGSITDYKKIYEKSISKKI